KCSNNGEYVLGRAYRFNEEVDNSGYSLPFILTGYGSEFRYLDIVVTNETITYWNEKCIGVSESGRNMIYSSGDRVYISRDYGQTFTSSPSPSASGIRDATIYDSGVGFADGYKTDNFFQTWTPSVP